MTSYDLIAELYDDDMGASAPPGDVAFYVAQARGARGKVLELGCGTGRITVSLAEAGCDVIGADRSLPMLRVLHRKAPAVHTVCMDMRAPALRQSFARIFCPYSAFTYLVDTDERDALLRWVRHSIAPEGRFVLDVFVPDPRVHALPDSHLFHDYRRVRADGTLLQRTKTVAKDVARCISNIERRYTLSDGSGCVLRQIVTRDVIRYYDPSELVATLEGSGFRVVEQRNGFADASAGVTVLVCISATRD